VKLILNVAFKNDCPRVVLQDQLYNCRSWAFKVKYIRVSNRRKEIYSTMYTSMF